MNKFVKWGEWIDSHEKEPSVDNSFMAGWEACKQEIIKILQQPIQNSDLSWEIVDERFIEKIKNL